MAFPSRGRHGPVAGRGTNAPRSSRYRDPMPSSTWDDRAEAPIERADSFADAPLPASGGRQRTVLASAEDPRLDLDTLLLRRDHPDLVVRNKGF